MNTTLELTGVSDAELRARLASIDLEVRNRANSRSRRKRFSIFAAVSAWRRERQVLLEIERRSIQAQGRFW